MFTKYPSPFFYAPHAIQSTSINVPPPNMPSNSIRLCETCGNINYIVKSVGKPKTAEEIYFKKEIAFICPSDILYEPDKSSPKSAFITNQKEVNASSLNFYASTVPVYTIFSTLLRLKRDRRKRIQALHKRKKAQRVIDPNKENVDPANIKMVKSSKSFIIHHPKSTMSTTNTPRLQKGDYKIPGRNHVLQYSDYNYSIMVELHPYRYFVLKKVYNNEYIR
ncbi:hypothetical protein K501DRAFT_274129 [Backusella circina FSU 941]|nr:hypothetical protein K501DRAFT_274129 [Backusella circina FSU 941]